MNQSEEAGNETPEWVAPPSPLQLFGQLDKAPQMELFSSPLNEVPKLTAAVLSKCILFYLIIMNPNKSIAEDAKPLQCYCLQ